MQMETSYAADLPLSEAAYLQVRVYEEGITKELLYGVEVIFPDGRWDHALMTRCSLKARQEAQRLSALYDKPIRPWTGPGLKLGGGY